MQKIQVFLREDQKAALEAISARSGERRSDLIRRGIDRIIEERSQETPDWRDAARGLAGLWRDRKDLDSLSQEFRAGVGRRFARRA